MSKVPAAAKASAPAKSPMPHALVDTQLDRLATNRRVAIPEPRLIPIPPKEYVPLSGDDRQGLRKLAGDLRSEALGALAQLQANQTRYRSDLGELVPDATFAEPLAHRLTAAEEAVTAAEALLQFTRDLESIAIHDAVEYLEAVNDELQHRLPKRVQLSTVYSRVRTLFDMRSAAMVEGRARAKKNANNGQGKPALAADLNNPTEI